mgnify:CR=1 FL=1
MNAFAAHFSFEFRSGLRNKGLLMLNYLFPLGFYLMVSALMTSLNPYFAPTLILAMAVFAVLSGAVLGLPNPLVEAREAGVLRSYRVNGVPTLSILVIPALTSMLHALIFAAIVVVTAPVLFGAAVPSNWPAFVTILVLTAFTGAGLGLLIGVISSSSRATVLWSQLIFLPSMMLGGLMMPSSVLPPTLKPLGMLLPTTYAMDAFSSLSMNASATFDPVWSVGILLAGGALSLGLAIYLYNWDSHNPTGRGQPALAGLAALPYVLGALLLA